MCPWIMQYFLQAPEFFGIIINTCLYLNTYYNLIIANEK